jgi:ubiquinone/menaquinone biosynthesis C-methylase UbiE
MAKDNRWLANRNDDGKGYDAKFEAMKNAGQDVHGEANFVMRYQPNTVLDAGCGTGRVAIELARRGCEVMGVDIDPKMLSRAQEKASELNWLLGDLSLVKLDKKFDLILMAGNVMVFVAPDTEPLVIANLASHLNKGGYLVAGFQLNYTLSLEEYDKYCDRVGLNLVERYSTWDGDAWKISAHYAVSVHQKS